MSHFPMSVDLRNQRVILVGSGPQIRDKMEKLRPFGPELVQVDVLRQENLTPRPAMVIAGDEADGEAVSALCREFDIPVNVVDKPVFCTFFFPAIISRGDLTVAISTGGKSPAGAVCLRRRIEEVLPDRTAEILDWLGSLRSMLPPEDRRRIMKAAAEWAFEANRPLTDAELKQL